MKKCKLDLMLQKHEAFSPLQRWRSLLQSLLLVQSQCGLEYNTSLLFQGKSCKRYNTHPY